MSKRTQPSLNAQIYDQASDWFVEFRSGEVAQTDRARFVQWLRASPEHQRAYLELAVIWNDGACLDPDRKYEESDLREIMSLQANIVSLQIPHDGQTRQVLDTLPSCGRASTPWRTWRALAASIAVAIVLASTWLYSQRGVYSTEVGEQRVVNLTDGSSIELNAQSSIRVRYSDRQRHVELLEGQALFHVARNRVRPFVVDSSGTRIRAVGTEFDVYERASGTVVSVVEGKVAIGVSRGSEAPSATRDASTPTEPANGELLLAAGEQAIVTTQATIKPPKPNIAAATAWTQRRVIFESAKLTEVAAEFNRYNRRRLVIQSPELYDFHITGTFSSTEPGSLVRFLQARPGITITETADEIVVSRSVVAAP